MPMPFLPSRRVLASALAAGGVGIAAVAGDGASGLLPFGANGAGAALAQGTSSLLEFRWDNTKDYRKLYFFVTDTVRLKRSEYFLILRPKDRKTAILKLTVGVPKHFDAKLDTKDIQLCKMSQGGVLRRTRCLEPISATIELTENGRAIEIFPETPISEEDTIGVYMRLFNPFNAGMYQFNALAQAPGEVPISGYLGSWLIQIDPN